MHPAAAARQPGCTGGQSGSSRGPEVVAAGRGLPIRETGQRGRAAAPVAQTGSSAVGRLGNPRARADCQSAKPQITNLRHPNRRGPRRFGRYRSSATLRYPTGTKHVEASSPGASVIRYDSALEAVRLREGRRGLVDRFEELHYRLTIGRIAQRINPAGAGTAVGHVVEHFVEGLGRAAVEVGRSREHRQ